MNKMKKILGLFLMSFMVFGMISGVIAEDADDEIPLPEAKKISAWGNFRDRMKFAFTFNNEKKVEVALEIAERRLAHIEALAETDSEAAEKAMEKYELYLARAEAAAARLEEVRAKNANESLDGISRMVRAQNRIEIHRERAEAMHLRALEHLEQSNASEEKIARFEGFYDRELEKLDEMEARFLEKKENAKIKYKVLAEKNETEVERRITKVEEVEGLLQYRKDRIARDTLRIKRYTAVKDREIVRVQERLQNANLTDEQRAVLQKRINYSLKRIENYEGVVVRQRNLSTNVVKLNGKNGLRLSAVSVEATNIAAVN